jgi:hypothetical protein
MSTETPLNAREWLRKNPRRADCQCGSEGEHLVIISPIMEEYARAVLAEAERALRERAKTLEVTEAAADVKLEHDEALYIAGEANGWFEAADLLAGMRR